MFLLDSVEKYLDFPSIGISKVPEPSEEDNLGIDFRMYSLESFKRKFGDVKEGTDFKFDKEFNNHIYGACSYNFFNYNNKNDTNGNNLCGYDYTNVIELLNILAKNDCLFMPECYLDTKDVEPCFTPSFRSLVVSDSTMSISIAYVEEESWKSYKIIDDCGSRKIVKGEFYFAVDNSFSLDLQRFKYVTFVKEITNSLGSYSIYLCNSNFNINTYVCNTYALPLVTIGKIKEFQEIYKATTNCLSMLDKSLSAPQYKKYSSSRSNSGNRTRFYVNIKYDRGSLRKEDIVNIVNRAIESAKVVNSLEDICNESNSLMKLGYSNLFCKCFYNVLLCISFKAVDCSLDSLSVSVSDFKYRRLNFSLILYCVRLFYFLNAKAEDLVKFDINCTNTDKVGHIEFLLGGEN